MLGFSARCLVDGVDGGLPKAVRGEERRVTGEGGYGGFCLVRREREKRKWMMWRGDSWCSSIWRLVRLEGREERWRGLCSTKWITNAEQSNELQSLISRGRRQEMRQRREKMKGEGGATVVCNRWLLVATGLGKKERRCGGRGE
ncbi:hypothetical protein HAX54_044247 [Datura stramonium]|uniref:Uncharacterized protein n=1 Tax=Datura stramonium TaxID=4076 RepID=A0ABS8W6U2_DATST|nr:hypothetical protein [Datura stramonium]